MWVVFTMRMLYDLFWNSYKTAKYRNDELDLESATSNYMICIEGLPLQKVFQVKAFKKKKRKKECYSKSQQYRMLKLIYYSNKLEKFYTSKMCVALLGGLQN